LSLVKGTWQDINPENAGGLPQENLSVSRLENSELINGRLKESFLATFFRKQKQFFTPPNPSCRGLGFSKVIRGTIYDCPGCKK
jgi:hypothetical protein